MLNERGACVYGKLVKRLKNCGDEIRARVVFPTPSLSPEKVAFESLFSGEANTTDVETCTLYSLSLPLFFFKSSFPRGNAPLNFPARRCLG